LWLISRSPEQDQQTLAALRPVFGWTAAPGLLSVLVLVLFLKERPRERPAQPHQTVPPAGEVAPPVGLDGTSTRSRPHSAALGAPFWRFTAVATLFALGNSSDAFLFLRTMSVDFWLEGLPLVYFGYNVVYALLATPAGALSDHRLGRVPVLVAGYGAFALVYLGWAAAEAPWHVYLLFMVYGVYAAATEGVAKALVVDLVPRAQRGTALGWFNGLTGFAALPANLLAGWIWSAHGPSATFEVSAILAFAATVLLALSEPGLRTRASSVAQATSLS
jgi:MFS family permease